MSKVYGVSVNGEPLLRTLFGHPRGAMINFLGAHANIIVYETDTYEIIKNKFVEIQEKMKDSDYKIELFEAELASVKSMDAPNEDWASD